MLKKILKVQLLLLGGILLGALWLILVYCLPVSTRSDTVLASMEILDAEGWYPTLPLVDSFEETANQVNKGGILDNYTDSIMISTAATESNGRPWYQAMAMENAVMGAEYSYYWHGYVGILRPLLLFFDYAEIRVMNEMLQFLLVLLVFYLVKRRKGIVWAMLSLSVYGLLFPMALAYSLQYSWVFYIATIGTIVLFLFEDFWKRDHNIYYFFMILGMLTSYFDLLTYPLITWAMPIVWWIVLDKEENSEASRVKSVIFSGLFWILGYGGMWAGKWLLGQLILQKPIILTAWNEVLYRAGMQEGTEESGVSHWTTIGRNFAQCNNIQYLLILGAWFLYLTYCYWKRKGIIQGQKALSLSVIAVSTFVWYIVLHNHTFVHSTFTYRIFTVFFVAVLAAFISSLEGRTESGVRKKGYILRQVVAIGIVGCSVLIALQEREITWRHNGAAESVSVLIEEGQHIRQDFTPVYSDVETLWLGIRAEGAMKGYFIVEVWQDDSLIMKREIPTADVADSGFYEIPTELKLIKGELYGIQIYLKDNKDTQGWISLTTEGNYVLAEFNPVKMGEQKSDAQIIGGLSYKRLPGKSKLMINFLTAMWALGAVWLCILNIEERCSKGLMKRHSMTFRQRATDCGNSSGREGRPD